MVDDAGLQPQSLWAKAPRDECFFLLAFGIPSATIAGVDEIGRLTDEESA
jgi:hypothetical protein